MSSGNRTRRRLLVASVATAALAAGTVGATTTASAVEAPPPFAPLPVNQVPATALVTLGMGGTSFPKLNVTATPTGVNGEVSFSTEDLEGECTSTTLNQKQIIIYYHNVGGSGGSSDGSSGASSGGSLAGSDDADTASTNGSVTVNPCASDWDATPGEVTAQTGEGKVVFSTRVVDEPDRGDPGLFEPIPGLPGGGSFTVGA